MLKNAGPELNLESDKMGHLIFMGESDSELFHSYPEALVRIKKIAKTETYTGSLYDTWGVLKIFFKTFQLGNFEKSTNLCFPYAKLGAKMEENGHF